MSESLEKHLLTIMSGQNLEATPHMRFFWEQQMHAVNKNGTEIPSQDDKICFIIAVIMDEMKIQENLVFDKTSVELIGFVGLGDPLTNFANVDEYTPVASHALAFLVRGLCTNLKNVVAYYFTGNVTSFQLMPLFWKVVVALESTVKLWVLAAVNDGASLTESFLPYIPSLVANCLMG